MNNELNDKISKYYSLKPRQFGVMKSLSLTQGIDPVTGVYNQKLSIVLARDESVTGEMLHLELFDIRNLRFEQPPFSVINLCLEITNDKHGQEFDRRIVVSNVEQDVTFACSCHDFIAVIA